MKRYLFFALCLCLAVLFCLLPVACEGKADPPAGGGVKKSAFLGDSIACGENDREQIAKLI